MDLTSHSVTLLSIIVGLGLTEMFGNLHRLIRNRTKVEWDWLPVAWAATLLILVVNYWWSIYLGVSGVERAGSAAEFGLVLIPPILLFLTTASVLPHFDAGEAWDMREHYAAQRKTFILTFSLYQISTGILGFTIGTFGWNVITVVRLIILALLVMMLSLGKRRWDWFGVLAILAVLIYRLTTQGVR